MSKERATDQKVIFGVNAFGHDASLSVVRGREILFASHSERYSRIKNDPDLCAGLIEDAIRCSAPPDQVVFYERPLISALAALRAGDFHMVRRYGGAIGRLRRFEAFKKVPISVVGHHQSHAAAGYFTSPFEAATIVVIDAIGELDTISVWSGRGTDLKRLRVARYPHSLGLLYGAFTQRVGLKPNEEEFIMMALAAFGEGAKLEKEIVEEFIASRWPNFRLRKNVHGGLENWRPDITSQEDISAAVQAITEEEIVRIVEWAVKQTGLDNVVLSGGVALNCVANSRVAALPCVKHIWIMPNPGDAGSSLGAALAWLRRRVTWAGPYLGHDIGDKVDLRNVISGLVNGAVVPFAQGRAEFGPRALGNRSLLADPRSKMMKARVNSVKRREPFRPFAPAVMAEHASSHFTMPYATLPYMQFACRAREPASIPAVVHVDGSSRVQTVSAKDNPAFYSVLEAFFATTGCPMLLNTSLNVKGEPIVNSREELVSFSRRSGLPLP